MVSPRSGSMPDGGGDEAVDLGGVDGRWCVGVDHDGDVQGLAREPGAVSRCSTTLSTRVVADGRGRCRS